MSPATRRATGPAKLDHETVRLLLDGRMPYGTGQDLLVRVLAEARAEPTPRELAGQDEALRLYRATIASAGAGARAATARGGGRAGKPAAVHRRAAQWRTRASPLTRRPSRPVVSVVASVLMAAACATVMILAHPVIAGRGWSSGYSVGALSPLLGGSDAERRGSETAGPGAVAAGDGAGRRPVTATPVAGAAVTAAGGSRPGLGSGSHSTSVLAGGSAAMGDRLSAPGTGTGAGAGNTGIAAADPTREVAGADPARSSTAPASNPSDEAGGRNVVPASAPPTAPRSGDLPGPADDAPGRPIPAAARALCSAWRALTTGTVEKASRPAFAPLVALAGDPASVDDLCARLLPASPDNPTQAPSRQVAPGQIAPGQAEPDLRTSDLAASGDAASGQAASDQGAARDVGSAQVPH